MASTLVHKTKIVPFLNKATDGTYEWIQIKKSSSFDLAANAQTKTFDFISSKVAQTEVDSYQPSFETELTMFKGEEDYELFFDLFYNLPTGTDAHRDLLLAWYQEEGEDANGTACYKAWLADATLQLGTLSSVNQTITTTISFTEPSIGAVYTVNGTPEFLEGTWSDGTFTSTSGEYITADTTEETNEANTDDGTDDTDGDTDGTDDGTDSTDNSTS